MPRTCLDTADAIELAEILQLIAGWLAADPERLTASLLAYIGHPAYGPDARCGEGVFRAGCRARPGVPGRWRFAGIEQDRP